MSLQKELNSIDRTSSFQVLFHSYFAAVISHLYLLSFLGLSFLSHVIKFQIIQTLVYLIDFIIVDTTK